MRTYRNLYHRIADFRRLLEAWTLAQRGKRYTLTAAEFEQHLDAELTNLYNQLSSETYQPGRYRSFMIHDPKRRKISAAPFRDRVVHHALCSVLIPIYERKFISDSYANRAGRGTHAALDRCTQFMQRYRYVLQCDIRQFFPSIDHAILKGILAVTITDSQVLRLCYLIIDSGAGVLDDEYVLRIFPGDDLFSAAERPRGLQRAQPQPVRHGISFLGFVVYPDHRRLKRVKGIAFRRHLYTLYERFERGEVDQSVLDVSIRAWVGHVMHGDTWGLRKAIFKPIKLKRRLP